MRIIKYRNLYFLLNNICKGASKCLSSAAICNHWKSISALSGNIVFLGRKIIFT